MSPGPRGEPSPDWRVLPLEEGDPEPLLRRGTALLDALEPDGAPLLRWYRASSAALVLGRGQREAVVPPPALAVVTRSSGGGAVLLDEHLLSLDLLIPARHPLLAGDVSTVFLHVGRMWAAALDELGVSDLAVHDGPAAPRRGSPRQRLLAAVCYATLGRGEVTAGGRKLVGLAQRRRRQGALVQCGLLRRWAPGAVLEAFGGDPADEAVLRAAVGLDELLDPVVPDERVMAVLEGVVRGYSLPSGGQ